MRLVYWRFYKLLMNFELILQYNLLELSIVGAKQQKHCQEVTQNKATLIDTWHSKTDFMFMLG